MTTYHCNHKASCRELSDGCLTFQALSSPEETQTAPIRKWSSTTPPLGTAAVSKTCSRTGTATPAVAAYSVAATHHDSLVRGSQGLRSPLFPPSLSQRRETTTSAGDCRERRGSSYLVAPPLSLLQRSSVGHPALPVFSWLTKQSKCLYLY